MNDKALLQDEAQARTMPDPLTIAYVAIGAMDAWAETPLRRRDAVTDEYNGQLHFVAEIIRHAPMLDQLADESEEDLAGVFVYEVAQAFGYEVARWMIAGETVDEAMAQDIGAHLLTAMNAA